MTYKTHFVGGICATALVSTVMPIENMVVVGAVSAFSALLPDIDIEGSKVNNKAGIVGKGVSSVFSHRGFIHTPILYIALYMLLSIVLPQAICLGFLIGTMSHLVLDTFNYKGIMWMYPFSKKHYHIASIKTRSVSENVFMIVMVIISAIMLIKGTSFAATNTLINTLSFEMPTFDFEVFRNFEISEFLDSSFVGKCKDFVNGMVSF